MKKVLKQAWLLLIALIASTAPGMKLDVERKLMPDAYDLSGYLYQLIGRTFNAVDTDSVTLVVMLAGVLWLCRRYLYHKPEGTGVGEYLLCGFFSVMQLLTEAFRQIGSVQPLYENAFQIAKAGLYVTGFYTLLLCGLRALRELLHNGINVRGGIRLWRIWHRHPFWFPALIIGLVWLPQIIIFYPGVLTIDTVLQFHQFANWTPRSTPHPPFGTLIYGLMIDIGLKHQCCNALYFLLILIKSIGFIGVLAYALWVMHKAGAPQWVQVFALGMFLFCPVYIGWDVAIGKDSPYLITTLLTGICLLEYLLDETAFLQNKGRIVLMAVGMGLMMLVRHNGLFVAVPVLGIMAVRIYRKRVGSRGARQGFLCLMALTLALGIGVEQIIIISMGFKRARQEDWLAVAYQQTGRVVSLHDEELPLEEKECIGRIFHYDSMEYKENLSDTLRASRKRPNTKEDFRAYFVGAWYPQLKRYPMDYLDATLAMNGVLFDLQAHAPMYKSITLLDVDENYIYPASFLDMYYYEEEQLLPLHTLQRLLTHWYVCFSEIPAVGMLARMSFGMLLMCDVAYLSWTQRRRRVLIVMLPALVTGIYAPFLPALYMRYLLPVMGAIPLWLAAYTCLNTPKEAAPCATSSKP